MANDKYAGYSPKKEEFPTKLDRVNPYEFRKGMDLELTSIGVSRLAESTPEEREKATETVLKNLDEHGGYYSALVHYETEYRNTDSKPSFKTFLKEFYEDTAMKEVKKDMKDKDNQMEKPKYDKSVYTLKEAIKIEIKNILSEAKDEDDIADKEAKAGAKKGNKAKIAKQIDKLAKERKDKEEKRQELFDAYKKTKKDKKATENYKKKVMPLQDRIKDIDKEVKDFENELADLQKEEKDMRREAASMMMDKKVHLEILNIVKEAGVSLREGSEGVKMYYEIAKMAYMEGLTSGLRGE
tara:strand:+ start:160 stop:1050 length:891 start_codon:yes stop_codon:yes gene_type:complete